MKKSIALFTTCFFAFILLGATTSTAQLSRSTIGIKADMNMSHLSVSGLSDEQNRLGYDVGAFARLGLTKSFAIQPEVLFATKGAELNYNTNFAHGSTTISLKYIDVPVLAVFNLTPNLNLHAGPYWSYLMNASAKNNSAEGSDFAGQINKDNFENTDYGYVLGAGVELGALNLGLRYVQGLKDVGKDSQLFGQQYNFPDGKNSAYQLYVGLSFF